MNTLVPPVKELYQSIWPLSVLAIKLAVALEHKESLRVVIFVGYLFAAKLMVKYPEVQVPLVAKTTNVSAFCKLFTT